MQHSTIYVAQHSAHNSSLPAVWWLWTATGDYQRPYNNCIVQLYCRVFETTNNCRPNIPRRVTVVDAAYRNALCSSTAFNWTEKCDQIISRSSLDKFTSIWLSWICDIACGILMVLHFTCLHFVWQTPVLLVLTDPIKCKKLTSTCMGSTPQLKCTLQK